MPANGLKIDSGSEDLNKKIGQWVEWDQNEKTCAEIKKLVENEQWDCLTKRLMNRLEFGTAGLRGVMQAGFNSMNDLVIIQSAQGLCQYILKCYPSEEDRARGIVLGYDGRYNSKRFAELSAAIFLNENIPVFLYSEMVATPFVPFAVLELKCLAGVMVTASHNPKEDNGYKVYWTNSAQIISPHDKNIQASILNNLVPLNSSWDLEILNSSLCSDPLDDMTKLYYEKMLQVIPEKYLKINESNDVKFVYSAMHGVGYPYVELAFKSSRFHPVHPVEEQQFADPEFSTVKFPNPEEGKSCLKLSMELAEKIGSTVILANDPDADRLACAEFQEESENWKVFTGNELGSLLGWWAMTYFKEKNPGKSMENCYFLASTVSSKMLRAMSNVEGFNFEETLTGFKWMGNRSVILLEQEKEVLFAFEEAIGFMFSPAVLDKDGVSASAHLATMCTYLKQKENLTLAGKLDALYKKYGYHYTMNSYFLCYEPKTIAKLFYRLRNFAGEEESYPTDILNGKYKIKYVRDLTTGKDTLQMDNLALLPSSKSSEMITFTFDNGTVITLRTSGTEPKVKYYAEYCAQPEETDWGLIRDTLKEMIEATVEEFLQPKENNLTARSD